MSRCPRSLLSLPTPLPQPTFYPFRLQKQLVGRSMILSNNGLINLEPDEEIHKERALGKSRGLEIQKLLNTVKADLSQIHTFLPLEFPYN